MAQAAGLVCALLLLASFCCQSLAQRGSAVPDKCCFIFQTTKLKRDNTVSCYNTSPACPQPGVMLQRDGKNPADYLWLPGIGFLWVGHR
uniref:Chemokine interleukin-8-like domain-containing protein n=1 Tax=Terrapene triunguis TaxID=2587831 RepID=A0A674JNC0_9SAUR